MRTKYVLKAETFVVSPANARNVLGAFLTRAKKELLIYDPEISDREMIRILQERAKAGVKVRVIGKVAGSVSFDVQKLGSMRLHTRTIIRDGHRAFIGSQSLRPAELDARRELGLIIQDAKVVQKLIDAFESDWTFASEKNTVKQPDVPDEAALVSAKEVEKAVQVFTKELDPLAISVKKAVRSAVAKAGDDLLHDKGVKETMKKVVKKAVKEAVKEAVQDAQEVQNAKAKNQM
jgi:phosphatidylserine/phosphatidylglycerophosphate/cardiolipin synthase-like enzyme